MDIVKNEPVKEFLASISALLQYTFVSDGGKYNGPISGDILRQNRASGPGVQT